MIYKGRFCPKTKKHKLSFVCQLLRLYRVFTNSRCTKSKQHTRKRTTLYIYIVEMSNI